MLEKLQTDVADFILQELIKELGYQGHIASGKLLDSLEVEVTEAAGLFSIDGRYLTYGKYVETGRKAGVKRVPIDALIEWIRVKRLDLRGKSERSVAFAIQAAIFKKGIPTDGDETKKRFVGRTLDRLESEIINRVDKIVSDFVQIEFDNIIAREQKELNRAA